jgi:hypothetical protein
VGRKMGRERKAYEELMSDPIPKFSGEDVDYRKSGGKEHCGTCIHFLERRVDDYGVCEIVRLEPDGPIEESYVCDYWTKDGERFPLLK